MRTLMMLGRYVAAPAENLDILEYAGEMKKWQFLWNEGEGCLIS